MRLRRAQAHLDAGFHHGLDEIKHIGRARARQRGYGIELRFLIQPQVGAGGLHHAFHGQPVGGGDGGAGKQGGLPQANQRRRVGHGAHHALAAQPVGNGARADAGGHAQVQCCRSV